MGRQCHLLRCLFVFAGGAVRVEQGESAVQQQLPSLWTTASAVAQCTPQLNHAFLHPLATCPWPFIADFVPFGICCLPFGVPSEPMGT